MNSPKFEPNQKVYIKHLNKEGYIRGWKTNNFISFLYTVCHKSHWHVDHGYGILEYAGDYFPTITVSEEDLELSLNIGVSVTFNDINKDSAILTDGKNSVLIKNIGINCEHSWKAYVGLNQTFDYCEKCDEKKL